MYNLRRKRDKLDEGFCEWLTHHVSEGSARTYSYRVASIRNTLSGGPITSERLVSLEARWATSLGYATAWRHFCAFAQEVHGTELAPWPTERGRRTKLVQADTRKGLLVQRVEQIGIPMAAIDWMVQRLDHFPDAVFLTLRWERRIEDYGEGRRYAYYTHDAGNYGVLLDGHPEVRDALRSWAYPERNPGPFDPVFVGLTSAQLALIRRAYGKRPNGKTDPASPG